ncbi:MAG TPA: hypothetical protein VFC78_15225 [Tepidisphaeraceae bacterium]|nr:hypothetical protein [Tepidisphaeraceae bacterium]
MNLNIQQSIDAWLNRGLGPPSHSSRSKAMADRFVIDIHVDRLLGINWTADRAQFVDVSCESFFELSRQLPKYEAVYCAKLLFSLKPSSKLDTAAPVLDALEGEFYLSPPHLYVHHIDLLKHPRIQEIYSRPMRWDRIQGSCPTSNISYQTWRSASELRDGDEFHRDVNVDLLPEGAAWE